MRLVPSNIGRLAPFTPLLALAVVTVALTVLMFRESPPPSPHPLPLASGKLVALDLLHLGGPEDRSGLGLSGALTDPTILRHAKVIRLHLATHRGTYEHGGAALTLGASLCRFTAAAGVLTDNSAIALTREGACPPLPAGPLAYSFVISPTDPGARIAAWTFEFSGWPGFEISTADNRLVWRAEIQDETGTRAARLELLRYMWRGAGDLWPAAVVFALGILGAGVLTAVIWRRSPVGLLAGGVLCHAALGLWYALLTPPFHGADEPDHFLGFGLSRGIPAYERLALDLANHGNFSRIKQNPRRPFLSVDTLGAAEGGWTLPGQEAVQQVVMEDRAILQHLVWRALPTAINSWQPEHLILLLRGLNVLQNSLAILALGLAAGLAGGGALAPLFLLVVPSLPYFGMAVSNYPLLLALFCLTAAALRRLAMPGGWTPVWAGLTGLALAMVTGASRTGLVLVAPVTLGALAWLWLELFRADSPLLAGAKAIPTVILPLGAGLALTPLMLQGSNLGQVHATMQRAAGGLLGPELVARLTPDVMLLGGLALIFLAPVGLGALARTGIPRRLADLVAGWLRWLPVPVACLWLLLCTKSGWQLPDIEQGVGFGMLGYASKVLRIFLRDQTLGGSDFYLTRTFWTGFSWLEINFPDWFVALVKLVPVALLFATMIAARSATRFWYWVGACAAGWAVYLALLAAAARHVNFNLHGRYMLGLYLFLLMGIFWLAEAFLPKFRERATKALPWWITGILGIHAFASWHLIVRYFG